MRRPAFVVFAVAAGLAGVALAQDTPGPGEGVTQERPVGSYAGVAPGSGNTAPRSPSPGGQGPLLMTWPGFQQRPDGASRFFLQTTAPVQVEQRTEEGRFVLLMKNTGLHLRNNRRPLETRYFNTPVSRATVERRGRDLALVLDLRAPVTPMVSQERAGTGFNFVFLEFPAGSYLPEELRTEAAQPPAEQPGGGETTEITVY